MGLAQGFSSDRTVQTCPVLSSTSVETENCHVHPHPPETAECWLGWECEQLPAVQGHFATGSFLLNCKGKGGLQAGKAAGSCFCLCLKDTSAWRELMSPPWCCSSQRSAVCWWFYHCLALLPWPWLNLSAWRLSSFHFIAGWSGNDFLNGISLKVLECAEKVLSKIGFFSWVLMNWMFSASFFELLYLNFFYHLM